MITALLKRLARIAWFLPGFFLWAAFPPMAERFDCLFALAPLLWLARRGEMKASALRWFGNGCIFWGATLSWMPAIIKNGGPWPLVVLGWAGLAAYCALYFAAFGALSAYYWRWTKRADAYWKRLVGLLAVEPVLWCGLELVRSRFLGGFAWNQLGVVPANTGFGAPAALGGVYLLSAVVILINGTIASIAERIFAPVLDRFAAKTAPNCVRSVETFIPFLLIWGIYSVAQPEGARRETRDESAVQGARRETRDVRVALVQRNAPCCFQAKEENPYPIYKALLQNVALLKPDLVVLAESALAEFGAVDRPGVYHFARFVNEMTGASLLAGGTRYEGDLIFNSAALFAAKDLAARDRLPIPETYDKVHLVPFGEFIPGDKLIPALQKLAPVGSCTAGKLKLLQLPVSNPQNHPTNNPLSSTHYPLSSTHSPLPSTHYPLSSTHYPLSLGVAICFEDTDSAQVRALARMGARALVFITNDSWFSDSDEAVQHAWQAVARAIETGLPVIRVGNSGVTGVIRPDGSAEWLNGADGRPLVDARGTMFEKIQVRGRSEGEKSGGGGEGRTVYVSVGDCPLAIMFALLILSLIVIKYLTIYEERRTLSL